MSSKEENNSSSTPVVLTLLFFWIFLVFLLFYLYKRLNRDTQGQYTVQRLIYSQGGLRDRVTQGIEAARVFVERIRPQNHDEEEAIGGDKDENGEGDEEEEEEGDSEGGCQNETNADMDEEKAKDDSSDDYSSIDLRERVNKNNGAEEEVIKEQKEEVKSEEKEGENKQEEGAKEEEIVSLLVNIKPFSGSANWSEEKSQENNMTAL